MRGVLRKRGTKSPERQVFIAPPANVWRHLCDIDGVFPCGAARPPVSAGARMKAMYGLDAPLDFQM
eukprot:5189159-Pyramimonas_sp.AAC.1